MKHIFWGLAFVFFHFRINGIDLLPDFLGYLFISYGLYTFAQHSDHFKNAMCCSIGMLIITLIDFLFLFITLDIMIYLVLQAAAIAITIMMFYFMIKGFKDLQAQKVLSMNTDKFMKIWRFQSVFLILSFVLQFSTSETLLYAAALITMLLFCTNIVFLFYVYQARRNIQN